MITKKAHRSRVHSDFTGTYVTICSSRSVRNADFRHLVATRTDRI